MRDERDELLERLKTREQELSNLRNKTDKDFAREIDDKERTIHVLELKVKSYLNDLAEKESVERRNVHMQNEIGLLEAQLSEMREQVLAETTKANDVSWVGGGGRLYSIVGYDLL